MSTGHGETGVVPWSEWWKALGTFLGAALATLVIGIVWNAWHEVAWVLLGFLVITVPNVLIRLARHRRRPGIGGAPRPKGSG